MNKQLLIHDKAKNVTRDTRLHRPSGRRTLLVTNRFGKSRFVRGKTIRIVMNPYWPYLWLWGEQAFYLCKLVAEIEVQVDAIEMGSP